jgi:hypothetical protein
MAILPVTPPRRELQMFAEATEERTGMVMTVSVANTFSSKALVTRNWICRDK